MIKERMSRARAEQAGAIDSRCGGRFGSADFGWSGIGCSALGRRNGDAARQNARADQSGKCAANNLIHRNRFMVTVQFEESQRDSGPKPRVARRALPWGKMSEG